MKSKKTAVIAGGGPAGLTAAYELATRSDIQAIVFEETDMLGGISRTVRHHGNRIDIGGHRFFSKSSRVNNRWAELMPVQTSPAKDESGYAGIRATSPAHDPETEDKVMLKRRRVSRIYYMRRFFDYPVSFSMQTIRSLGIKRTIKAGTGYLWSMLHKRKERSLEDFYINRFGKPLYKMFFEGYTEKVWGVHPSGLGADWGSQRVKGLSLKALFTDFIGKKISSQRDTGKIETSLIEEFLYPKLGPGQLWELTAEEAVKQGAIVEKGAKVKGVRIDGNRVTHVTVEKAGKESIVECDFFVSSMPLKDLIASISGIEIPEDIRRIASELPYRDFITVGMLVDKLKIKNETKLRTYMNRVPDTWIYVQENNVKPGRIQIFNNWSPYLVKDFENKMWIGIEYFCNEGDDMWEMSDSDFISLAVEELESIGIIDSTDVEDTIRIKVKKAYPAYYGSYYQLHKVREFLDGIENLYCVGRNGQHRYNNMDHSMLTAMKAADSILSGDGNKSAVWDVNTEKEYHEK